MDRRYWARATRTATRAPRPQAGSVVPGPACGEEEVFRDGWVAACFRVGTGIRAHPLCWEGAPVLGVTSDVRAAVPEQCPERHCAPFRTAGSSRLNPGHVSVLAALAWAGCWRRIGVCSSRLIASRSRL